MRDERRARDSRCRRGRRNGREVTRLVRRFLPPRLLLRLARRLMLLLAKLRMLLLILLLRILAVDAGVCGRVRVRREHRVETGRLLSRRDVFPCSCSLCTVRLLVTAKERHAGGERSDVEVAWREHPAWHDWRSRLCGERSCAAKGEGGHRGRHRTETGEAGRGWVAERREGTARRRC